MDQPIFKKRWLIVKHKDGSRNTFPQLLFDDIKFNNVFINYWSMVLNFA